MSSLIATITDTGIEVPTFDDCLSYLQAQYRSIYGSDVNIDPDTQDGQFLAILAQGYSDANQLLAAVFRSFSPSYAQGTNLSSLVKINGIQRLVSTNSQQNINVGGTVGTVITNGVVQDSSNLRWDLPATVTIPGSGSIVVTTLCETPGALTAIAPLTILTPTRGWATATLNGNTVVGQPVETDAALRRRQAVSTALPAQTPLAAIFANVANIVGVTRLKAYENDTGSTDANGIPAHTVSMVVEGGDAFAIATAIFDKKAPGVGTFGTTSENVIDSAGVIHTISFFTLTSRTLSMLVNLTGLEGYVSSTGDSISASLSEWISSLDIGETSYLSRLFAPANLMGDAATTATGDTQTTLDILANTYNITSIYQALDNMKSTATYAAGTTVIVVASGTNYHVGDKVGCVLDNTTTHFTSLTAVSGASLTLAAAVPAGRSINTNALIYVAGDAAILFNEAANTAVANITVTVS